jgi:hypothetical protein
MDFFLEINRIVDVSNRPDFVFRSLPHLISKSEVFENFSIQTVKTAFAAP